MAHHAPSQGAADGIRAGAALGGRFFGSDGQDDMSPSSPFPGSRAGVPGMCHFLLAAAGV